MSVPGLQGRDYCITRVHTRRTSYAPATQTALHTVDATAPGGRVTRALPPILAGRDPPRAARGGALRERGSTYCNRVCPAGPPAPAAAPARWRNATRPQAAPGREGSPPAPPARGLLRIPQSAL